MSKLIKPQYTLQKRLSEQIVLSHFSVRTELSNAEASKLDNLQKGHEGEQTVINFIKEFGHENWKIFKNVWIGTENSYEIDILVVGNMGWLFFEVKNYDCKFTYENGICMRDNFTMSNNIISQTQKILINNSYLMQRMRISGELSGALVFIGDHSEIEIKDHVEQISILSRNQLKRYISHFTELENQAPSNDILEKSIHLLEKVEVPSPFALPILDEQRVKTLKRGIYCPECFNFNYVRFRYWFVCECGAQEVLSEAVLRTLHDFCVIFHGQNVTRRAALEFMDYQVSSSTVSKILNENFDKVGSNRWTEHLNPYLNSKKNY